MCGIFGYSGKNPVDKLRLSWLAVENQVRGDDATGIYGNSFYKKAKKARDFVQDDEFIEAIEGCNTIIGHTRRATIGAKTDRNAHPFAITAPNSEEVLVYGTHNGQIFPTLIDKLADKLKIDKCEVDSEFLYSVIVHCNFDYDEALSQIEGMMALAFIRPQYPDLLYLYRRLSRPLHVGFVNSVDMYYSSEIEPLHLIGCTATTELEPDKLYVFKKGGLVGVSPVKKSLIHITTRDQTITSFLSTATHHEKNVLGIVGADAPKKNVHTTGNQKYLPAAGKGTDTTQKKSGTDGGQSRMFHREQHGNRLRLPEEVNEHLYTEEINVQSPGYGRHIDSSDFSCGYLFAQLVSNYGTDVGLPCWLVRVRQDKTINCISTHNGIVALRIPLSLCGLPITLEMVNPIQQDVIYTVEIPKIIASRVLEVTLRIPFQDKEETSQGSYSPSVFYDPSSRLFIQREDANKRLHKLPTFKDFFKGGFSLFNSISGSDTIDVPAEHESGELKPPFSAYGNESTQDQHETRANSSNAYTGQLDFEFNDKTDILNMDYYTAQCNLDEINGHLDKSRELLTAVDPDPRDLRHTLVSIEAFLEFMKNYLESRISAHEMIDKVEDDEEEDFCLTEEGHYLGTS